MLQSMRSQSVKQDLATEQQQEASIFQIREQIHYLRHVSDRVLLHLPFRNQAI